MSKFRRRLATGVLAGSLSLSLPLIAQTGSSAGSNAAPPAGTATVPTTPSDPQVLPPPQGTVLFESHGEPGSPQGDVTAASLDAKPTGPELTDRERGALTVTSYDLDVRLTPATHGANLRARLTLRNMGSEPLTRLALQISSTLIWQSASLVAGLGASATSPQRLTLAQHLLDTDADHTGRAQEAIVALPEPLPPGASLTLDTFYGGVVAIEAGRLERIGASAAQAAGADWDAIAPPDTNGTGTALRGFGDVLWYPVASPQLFLGDGARLFQAIRAARLREQTATMHLRLTVEYRGEPPVAAYFCGRRQALKSLADDADSPVASGAGIATADFPTEPLGFRTPSLFVIDHAESLIAPLPPPPAVPGADAASSSSSSSAETPSTTSELPAAEGAPMLAVETADDASLPLLAASAQRIAPLLQRWFGPEPLSTLTVLDHTGQPFEDGPFLVAPVPSLAASSAATALVHSLTHAWVQTGEPWMDEGLAQFAALLWTERESGRDAATAQLDDLVQPLALAEPDFSRPADAAGAADQTAASSQLGQPLVAASDEVYFRRKAAAVWWMLRGLAGDVPLQRALAAWRTQPASVGDGAAKALAFEKLLEGLSGKQLGWFFNDWILHDRGLPDLEIGDVSPRALPTVQGHDHGWLVAVSVRNDGAAAAEVPLVVRSGDLSITRRIHVPGLSTVTERVVIEAEPTEVLLNDGSVPEVRSTSHRLTLHLHTES